MAASRKYVEPAEQMLAQLASSKAAGVPFEKAWAYAWIGVGFSSWGHNSQARRTAKRALAWSRDAWQRAYEDTDADRRDGSAVVLPDPHSATHNVRIVKM
jgi:hypothetical protein